jgi:hypothetical protein
MKFADTSWPADELPVEVQDDVYCEGKPGRTSEGRIRNRVRKSSTKAPQTCSRIGNHAYECQCRNQFLPQCQIHFGSFCLLLVASARSLVIPSIELTPGG